MNIDELHGEELFSYIRANKSSLIKNKQDTIKYTDAVVAPTVVVSRLAKETADKAASEPDPEPVEKDTLDVTIVCNVAWVCDSHMDVLTDKAYTESIKARGTTIPHIADHKQTSTSHVGDVTKVYTKVMSLKELGLNQEGSTTALLMDSTVRKDYNEDVFKFYANGKINQHSVGLSYGEIKFAMNSDYEGDKAEKEIWDANYANIVNKELVDKRGYFYLVPKVDIRENSCVLFGANPLTPTLSVKSEAPSDVKDSSLGNDAVPTTQPSKGVYMTLEEAQGKIISLTEELAKAKSDVALARLEATTNEKTRTLGILKAQATFGSEANLQKAALSFIDKGLDIDTAITSFEVIKESLQTSNGVDTSKEGLTPTVNKEESADPLSFEQELPAGMKAAGEQPQLFKGVR